MEKRLYLSKNDKKIAGVCGGIAEYFNVDPTLIRLIWLVMIFAFGTGLLVYIIAAIVIPEKEGTASTINLSKNSDGSFSEEGRSSYSSYDEEKGRNIIGYILIALGGLLFAKRIFPWQWISFKFLGPAILIGIGLIFIGKGRNK